MLSSKVNYMKKSNVFLVVILFLCLVTISGCAGKLTANKKLIKQFEPAFVPEKNESLVYVIRKNQTVGATRGLFVALNDKIISNIHTGDYCYFKIDNGINTVNLEQSLPFHFFRLDNRAGEIIFLYFEMISITTGKFSELPTDLGITAVMESKMAKDIGEPKINNWYTSGLMNPEFVDLYLMKKTDNTMIPDSENAIITFIRPQTYKKDMAFGIWSESKFLGNLKCETYFQIKVPTGKYNFFGKSEHFSSLKADVEAGKNYYIQVAASGGWLQPHIRLLPVTIEKKQSEIQAWLDSCNLVTVDEMVLDTRIKERLDLALPYIKTVINDIDDGKSECRFLNIEDGLQY